MRKKTADTVMDEPVESASPTPTAVAAEAAATGVVPLVGEGSSHEIPHDGETLRVGDPDVSELDNAYVGDTVPGGDMPTPDQGGVDDVGRAMGVQEEDSGALRTSSEVLDRRDRHRQELEAPSRPARDYEP